MARPRKLPAGIWSRGGVYYARFRTNGRLVRRRLSSDLDTAKRLLNELKARADAGDFGILDNDYPWKSLRGEFLKFKRQTSRNPSDYAEHLAAFERYCRIVSVRQVTAEYVVGFRAWRLAQAIRRGKKAKQGADGQGSDAQPAPEQAPTARTVSPRTVNKEVGTLRHMLNLAVEWGRIGSNPIAGIKPLRHDAKRKERRALTLAEVESLFQASPDYLRPVWRAFMVTGIRKNELARMRFADVDFERRVVTVQAGTAKNHKPREVPLDDDTLATIAALRDAAPDRQHKAGRDERQTVQQRAAFSRDHVFVTKANTPWRNNLLTRFYAICKRAGIEGAHKGGSVDIHSLRVTFTTLALEGGASPKAVQAILGHSTLALTMGVYARATDRSKRDAVAALPFARMTAPAHTVAFPVQDAHKARTSSKASPQVVDASAVG
jgi:integrase